MQSGNKMFWSLTRLHVPSCNWLKQINLHMATLINSLLTMPRVLYNWTKGGKYWHTNMSVFMLLILQSRTFKRQKKEKCSFQAKAKNNYYYIMKFKRGHRIVKYNLERIILNTKFLKNLPQSCVKLKTNSASMSCIVCNAVFTLS